MSAVWGAADPELRSQIEKAVRVSVEKTISLAEAEIPLARRGKAGRIDERAQLVCSLFLHYLSRDLEPQLHVHAVIANVVARADGTWGTLHSRALYRWARTLGPLFRASLAHELQSLGFSLTRGDRLARHAKHTLPTFEVVGVPLELREHWSSRSRALESLLAGRNPEFGDLVSGVSARTRQKAVLATRKGKQKGIDMDFVLAGFEETARKFGFDPNLIRGKVPIPSAPYLRSLHNEALRHALKRITREVSHFTARELIKQVAELCEPLGMPGEWIFRRTKRALTLHPEIVPLKLGSEKQFTTETIWQLERVVLDKFERIHKESGAHVTAKDAAKLLGKRKHKSLSPEQRQAAIEVLTRDSRLKIISGVAGSGKTHALRAIREGFEKAGYSVVGGALSGIATLQFEGAKIRARTLASHLWNGEMTTAEKRRRWIKHTAIQLIRAMRGKPTYQLPKNTLPRKVVFILDEASMVDTKTMHRLLIQLEKRGSTLVLVGDAKQLPSIEGASPFKRVRDLYKHVVLSDHRRQRDVEDRKALVSIREGKIKEALDNYASRGRLVVGRNRQDTFHKIVQEWTQEKGWKRPRDFMVVTQTRDEAKTMNEMLQRARRRKEWKPSLHRIKIDGVCYGRSDRVMFHVPLPKHGIVNAQQGTIKRVDPLWRTLWIELDGPKRRWFRKFKPRVVKVSAKELEKEAISLGYAGTTHKLQGVTVKHAMVLVGGSMDASEMFYVGASRASHTTKLFVDKTALGDNYKDLTKSLERSCFKAMAHDLERDKRAPTLSIERAPE